MPAALSPTARPWRLGVRGRKLVLLVHIASAGAWVGLDVAMAALVFAAVRSDEAATKAFCYQALELFAIWPLFATGLVCLASGVLMGLGTSYGLLRYWWVVIKLALNLLLAALVLVALRPVVTELAGRGALAATGASVSFDESNIVFPPVVSPTLLLVAFTLAVFKPWGLIRRNARGNVDLPIEAED